VSAAAHLALGIALLTAIWRAAPEEPALENPVAMFFEPPAVPQSTSDPRAALAETSPVEPPSVEAVQPEADVVPDHVEAMLASPPPIGRTPPPPTPADAEQASRPLIDQTPPPPAPSVEAQEAPSPPIEQTPQLPPVDAEQAPRPPVEQTPRPLVPMVEREQAPPPIERMPPPSLPPVGAEQAPRPLVDQTPLPSPPPVDAEQAPLPPVEHATTPPPQPQHAKPPPSREVTREEAAKPTRPAAGLPSVEPQVSTRTDAASVPHAPELPSAVAGWNELLSAWLAAHKRYPEIARQRGQEGTVTLRWLPTATFSTFPY
jgi:hypothetical protein